MGKVLVIVAALSALAWFTLFRPGRTSGRLMTALALVLPLLVCLFAILILRF